MTRLTGCVPCDKVQRTDLAPDSHAEADMISSLIDRRLFIYAMGSAAVVGAFGMGASARAENRILAIAYDADPTDPNGDHLRDNLTGPGNTVNWVRGPSRGRLAQELGQSAYDQVWIWDAYLLLPAINDADRAALASWFLGHQSVVLDSRSLGLWYDNDPSEMMLSKNIVASLGGAGGGLWVGAKQGPDGVTAANKYLSALGFNPFSGGFFDMAPLTGSPNPLLTNPNFVNVPGLAWNTQGSFSRSAAPTGPQPNGLTLQTVVSDSHGNPLITTNIPEPPGAGLWGGLGAGLLGWARRRRP